ncbi:MAG: YciI family protein [Betaproteobacteria bacterium]|nr:YciI family protein [Betaproteobacteria bacterium]
MKYLCLVYLDAEHWSACPDDTCFEFAGNLQASGKLLAAEPLHPVHTATTVRVRNGQATLYDGPFTETKEQLAGFYLIDARDLNDALHVAAQIPPAKYGSIEVRPVRELAVAGYHAFTPAAAPAA